MYTRTVLLVSGRRPTCGLSHDCLPQANTGTAVCPKLFRPSRIHVPAAHLHRQSLCDNGSSLGARHGGTALPDGACERSAGGAVAVDHAPSEGDVWVKPVVRQ